MKVFLSWSAPVSHKVACAFREWLPSVIQSIVPYVSSEDIDKGARWSTDIAKELEDSRYGIICITRENMHAPWVNFEAGALSKIIDKSCVSPFLFDLKRSDVQGPLLQFQSTIWDKEDILKLIKSINARSPDAEKLKEDKLIKAFEVWWPQLNDSLNKIKQVTSAEEEPAKVNPKDKAAEILEELLELARTQQRIISNPPSLLPPDYIQHVFERAGMRMSRNMGPDFAHHVHRTIVNLEDLLASHKKDHEAFEEALSMVRMIHGFFHEMPEWPREFIHAEPKRTRRKSSKDESA